MTGNIEGRRDRGKQRLTFTRSLSNWMGIEGVEMIRASQDREKWSVVTSQVCMVSDIEPEDKEEEEDYYRSN